MMKKTFLTFTLIIMSFAMKAQEGTFKVGDDGERFLVKADGKVGIGTTSPGVGTSPDTNLKLQVNGGVTLSSGSKLSLDQNYYVHAYLQFESSIPTARFKHYGYYGQRFDDNGGTRMVIQQGGNVGIGTIAPSEKLEINGNVIFNNAGSANTHIRLGHDINDAIIADNRTDKHYGGGYFFRVHDESLTHKYRDVMMLSESGKVGIGTAKMGEHRLAVEGSIGARKVKVELTTWSDFVFEKDYNLPTLQEVATHIAEKGHLKDIPSAKEVAENGIFLGEMNAKLLQKIEELTLYAIQQEKKIQQQEEKVQQQAKELASLKDLATRLAKIEALLESEK